MSGDSGYRAFSTQHHIMIRQETIDTILERTDIVALIGEHVHIRKCGSRYVRSTTRRRLLSMFLHRPADSSASAVAKVAMPSIL